MNLHQRLIDQDVLLLQRYRAVRAATEGLAAPLSAEDQNLQPMADASPVKWHRAHTSWFFETFILKAQDGYREFDSGYAILFNSYYGSVGPRHARPERGLLSRPGAEEISAYRRHVDEAMEALLAGGTDDDTRALVELGLNHEEQHQELILTDILNAFARNPLKPAYGEYRAAPRADSSSGEVQSFDGGMVEIGHEGEGFAFDNEGPCHSAMLAPFRLATTLVTNREWLEFMLAGGYREERLWLSDGWQCAQAEAWQAPLYWESRGGEWFGMSLAGLQLIDWDAPVAHLSFYEADAFARWRDKRLPTEFEWEHAASSLDPDGGNFREAGFLRALPANASGLQQMFGDVWEWTASAYSPYPGYRAPEGAVGEYNGKFMINQMVLRGGSCVTPRGHVRATYRNFFHPHQRWQFSGLRLAEDAPRSRSRATENFAEYEFLKDVWEGFSHPQKRIGSKYFYDGRGAELFEQICRLPEYYLTRTECALLADLAPDLAGMIAPATVLVEFGCGSCLKTRILLNRLPQVGAYVPIDICGYSLGKTVEELAKDYPELPMRPLVGDFMKPIALPEDLRAQPILGFFPGSTIGNLTDEEADAFLARARTTLGPHGRLLIGIDLIKGRETLLAAYNDAAGVTAAFNKNVLVRVNRELGADFDLDAFSHRAVWNDAAHRIEMHLVSDRAQTVTVGGRNFHFAAGETIHTENCHKYDVNAFAERARASGWTLEHVWTSASPEFGILLLK
jgi:dimethylhistidine N-methyltransferase